MTLEKRQITLRTAVILPFSLIFIAVLSIIIFTQEQSYHHVVDDISNRQLTVLTDSVQDNLNNYLSKPLNAVQMIAHNISYHNLYQPHDNSQIQDYLLKTFQQIDYITPQLDVLGFGSKSGDYVGFRREQNQGYTLMLQDKRTDNNLVIYRDSKISQDIRSIVHKYDPRTRPWYRPIADVQHPMWSKIYANADEKQDITISAMAPIYKNDHFSGVLVADVRINSFNEFLHHMQQNSNANIYIMDKDMRLVAQSGLGSVLSWGTKFSSKGQRLLATESNDLMIQKSARIAQQHHIVETNQGYSFEFTNQGKQIFSRITPYVDDYGITWFIGTSIPESVLLGHLPQSQHNSWLIGLSVSLAGIIFSFIVFSRVTRQINATAKAARNLAKGDWDHHMPQPGIIYETNILANAFGDMANHLKETFKTLNDQLIYDSLTHLYNREGLVQSFDKTTIKHSGSLYLVRVNRFRDLNDSIGYQNSEQLIINITDRLKLQLGDSFIFARTDSHEFAIYSPTLYEYNNVNITIGRVRQVFTTPFLIDGNSVVMNISIGVVKTDREQSMTQWLRNASIALNCTQQSSSQITHYRPEMANLPKFRTQMLAKIQTGIDNNEFIPYYQPIIDLKSGAVKGAEALARWNSETGMISPIDFIPVAEESHHILAIGQQILMQACNDTARFIQVGHWPQDFHIHVNISVNQLASDDFITTVQNTLSTSKLPPENLILEIIESRIVDSSPILVDNMNHLRTMGIGIAIDDFGTGYSSLAYLHELPFTCLKIDRTFINQLTADNIETSVVAAVMNITKGFDTNIVAEGVETLEQVEILKQLGCPQVQGFLYSRPVAIEDWPTLLQNNQ